jgi:hypothetical protein
MKVDGNAQFHGHWRGEAQAPGIRQAGPSVGRGGGFWPDGRTTGTRPTASSSLGWG